MAKLKTLAESAAMKVKDWESRQLCAPESHGGEQAKRCTVFHHNCHDCLTAFAVNQEYENIVNNLAATMADQAR